MGIQQNLMRCGRLAAGFVLLAGCSERKSELAEYTRSTIQQRPVFDPHEMHQVLDPITGKPILAANSPHGFSLDGVAGRPANSEGGGGGGVTSTTADFMEKADVFWKLNWMKKQIHATHIPEDFEQSVQKTQMELEKTFHDRNYQLAHEALEFITEWIAHQKAEEKLRRNNITLSTIPWASGRDAVQRHIESGRLGFGGKPFVSAETRSENEDTSLASAGHPLSVEATLTPAQQEIVDLILMYTTTYHASPPELRRRAGLKFEQSVEALLKNLRKHPAAADHPGLDSPEAADSLTLPDYPANSTPPSAGDVTAP